LEHFFLPEPQQEHFFDFFSRFLSNLSNNLLKKPFFAIVDNLKEDIFKGNENIETYLYLKPKNPKNPKKPKKLGPKPCNKPIRPNKPKKPSFHTSFG